jgi:hypothetical protein
VSDEQPHPPPTPPRRPSWPWLALVLVGGFAGYGIDWFGETPTEGWGAVTSAAPAAVLDVQRAGDRASLTLDRPSGFDLTSHVYLTRHRRVSPERAIRTYGCYRLVGRSGFRMTKFVEPAPAATAG